MGPIDCIWSSGTGGGVYETIKNTGPRHIGLTYVNQGMLHVGVADNFDLHSSLAIFTWLSLHHCYHMDFRVDSDVNIVLSVYFFSFTAC